MRCYRSMADSVARANTPLRSAYRHDKGQLPAEKASRAAERRRRLLRAAPFPAIPECGRSNASGCHEQPGHEIHPTHLQ